MGIRVRAVGDDQPSDRCEPAGETEDLRERDVAADPDEIAEIERRYEEARDACFRLCVSGPEDQ